MVVLGTVCFGDDSVARIKGRNTIMFVCKNDESRSLEGVYFIPRLTTNNVSIRQLNEVGYKIDIDIGMMKIQEPRGMLLVRVNREANRFYLLHIKLVQSVCFTLREWGDEVVWRWHECFRHINMAALLNLARQELVCVLPEIGHVEQFCEACQVGKQWCTSFPVKAEYRARQYLELVHGDLCGPIAPVMLRG
jgi:hypothetical protein